MSSNDKVLVAKNALMAALGENSPKYLSNMKMWFRNKWTKEEFDRESRKLLSSEKAHLHNQFLLAILNKIDSVSMPVNNVSSSTYNTASSSRSNRKRKRTSNRFISERATFDQYDLHDFLTDDNFECIRQPSTSDGSPPPVPTQKFCVQELFLPDAGFIMGRFLVGAWEAGLVTVDDTVAECVVTAVQILLKNIISSIVLKRKHFRVTNGSFFYDVGNPIKDPFVRTTVTKQKIDDGIVEIDKEITTMNIARKTTEDSTFLSACEEVHPRQRKIITVNDVYRAFQDKNVIPSHSVYSVNIERLSQMLH